ALDQLGRLRAVDLRPAAARPPWREALEEPGLVERLALAVDPAEGECDLQRLGVRHGGDPAGLLGDLQPQPVGFAVVLFQPRRPRLGCLERALSQTAHGTPPPNWWRSGAVRGAG